MQRKSKTRERNQKLVSEFKSGKVISSLARDYNLTPQRVQQILRANEVTAKDGGQHVSSKPNKALRKQKTIDSNNRRAKELYGITHDMYKELRAKSIKLVRAYTAKKHSALHKDIEFSLSLNEWFSLWEESGQSDNFGRGEGKYCLGRIDDDKGFTLSNVEVIEYKSFMVKTALRRKRAKDK